MRAAGVILIVLGALWAAVGAVLLVVSMLWSNPGDLPDWVEAATSDPAAPGRLALLGVLGLGTGLAQLVSGLAVQRPRAGWAPRLGLGAAVFGGVVTGSWLVSGLSQGLPAIVFLPVVAAYAYAAWALAFTRPA